MSFERGVKLFETDVSVCWLLFQHDRELHDSMDNAPLCIDSAPY